MNWLTQKITDIFGLDPRSLAVLRIGLGITLLLDISIRAMDVEAMYSGYGFVPIETSIKSAGPWGWSLHWISGELWFQWTLFAIAYVLAIGVLLGWQTRWMVLGSFILLASIQTRNQVILNGGDAMFRVMLFWAIFLPLGRVWSLDARRRLRKGHPPDLKPVLSVASFCFILQLCLVYWFAGTAKLNDLWLGFDPEAIWSDPALLASASFGGEAMERAMSYDIYCKPLAGVLAQAPWFLRLICIGTLILEIIGPCLLFLPFGTRWMRLLLVVSFAMLHIGIELTLHVGMFSWVSLSAWAALLPAMFWDSRLLQRLRWPAKAVEVEETKVGPAWPAMLPPPVWGWAKFIGCQLMPAVVCIFFMSITLAWNLSYNFSSKKRDGEEHSPREKIQRPIRRIANATCLRQRWNMFSKTIANESWIVSRAELKNGEVVDVLKGGRPVELKMPNDLSSTYSNHRWRKLNVLLCSKQWRWRKHREPVAQYLCRTWNASHDEDEQIVRLELYKLTEKEDAPDRCSRSLCLTIFPESTSSPEEDGASATEEIAAVSREQ